jgi:hypothetical protein
MNWLTIAAAVQNHLGLIDPLLCTLVNVCLVVTKQNLAHKRSLGTDGDCTQVLVILALSDLEMIRRVIALKAKHVAWPEADAAQ